MYIIITHFSLMIQRPTRSIFFPYTTLFRSDCSSDCGATLWGGRLSCSRARGREPGIATAATPRSEEHTSELQSRVDLVCRLLLEKKKNGNIAESERSYYSTDRCLRHLDLVL